MAYGKTIELFLVNGTDSVYIGEAENVKEHLESYCSRG